MDPALAIEKAALYRQKALNDAIALGDSEVQRFYNNSVVFLTGGSGFIGKQLIEKLFRSCNLSKAFLLLRTKKGKNVQQRLDDIVKEPVFDTLREKQPDFATKIVAVEGNVAEIKLGLKDEDWKTLSEEVDVIFHVAATTKFDETLRVATLINVRGTREILLLGKACKNLRTFVHVSTAYSHATSKVIDQEVAEEFYKIAIPPETLISMAETMDSDRLIGITPELIQNWPNTYSFTKSIAEELVRTSSAGLPICIVRPGVVLCSYNEPSPGWIDVSCVYGATGLLAGAGLGLLHTIDVNIENIMGFIPCDYVNNAVIAAGKETATNQTKGGNDTRIYTVCTTQRNPINWSLVSKLVKEEGLKFPTPTLKYYPCVYENNNKLIHMLLFMFLVLIPAYVADFVCRLLGKERRFAKIVKKVYNMSDKLSYYLTSEWQFVDDNVSKLYSSLSNQDKIIFNFDVTNINWSEYMILWWIGVRKYIYKDGLKGTNYAIKKQRLLGIAHYIFMAVYLYGICKLVSFVFNIGSTLILNLINFY